MKRWWYYNSLILLLMLMPLARHAMAQQRLVMPAALKAGDTIAIVSPSSTPDTLTVAKGCETLREWGYVPVVGPHAMNSWHGFAGTADERAADLLWALRDSTVKAILCSRGGDGAVQVLQHIPLQEFRDHPKWVMGFSDATALHSAEVSAGVMSIHSSMCDGISMRGERDSVNAILQRLLQGELPTYQVPAHPLNQQGVAEGILVGGNLSVFCGLAGSDYDFLNRAKEGLILFFEDTGEAMSKVDRMLHLLEIRGILSQLKGIIVGHFSKYKSPENDFADMYDMLHEYLQHYDIPVCYDFLVGHHSGLNYPMVEGCRVVLNVGPDATIVAFQSLLTLRSNWPRLSMAPLK
jgi:muramoyltetrapeptide carboxypeptidase